jgi:hypothetical protein
MTAAQSATRSNGWTPGPWLGVIHGDSEMGDTFHLGPQGDEYAGVAFTILEGALVQADDAENEANAHLIAAAPCLYEALEAVDRMFSAPGRINKNAVRDKVRAALSRARGEA